MKTAELTNGDVLRDMPDRELADFLHGIAIDGFACGWGAKDRSDWYGISFFYWLRAPAGEKGSTKC